MLKRMLWVLPLVLALSSTWLDAQNPERRTRPPQGAAPELDPRASGAALALLVGGALLLSERRRRRKPQPE
jgi:cytochrome c-type biogenesis protein CcmH/NrfF